MTPRVLVTRAAAQADVLMDAFATADVEPVLVPAIAVEQEPAGGDLDRAVRRLAAYRWTVVTSANGARAAIDAVERQGVTVADAGWASVGRSTSEVLRRAGVEVAFEPSRSTARTLAEELPVRPGDRVLVIRGDVADATLRSALRARGASADDVVAYRTVEAPASSLPLLRDALASGPIDALVFTSGSTVRGLLTLANDVAVEVRSIPAVCIGPETATAARNAGFVILAVASSPDPDALVSATAARLIGGTRWTPGSTS